jgi:hypothetical protein
MAAGAAVHIGVIFNAGLVREYFQRCALETPSKGAARFPTGEISSFATLEELLDHLLARDETTHVIVNHGNDKDGLLVPFAAGAQHNATGRAIEDLSALANEARFFLLARAHLPPDSPKVTRLAPIMGVRPATVARLAEKLAEVRKKKLRLEIRGCNIGKNATMLKNYKAAFGADAVTAPSCRMFYVRILPHKPRRGTSLGQLSGQQPTTAKTRRRLFAIPRRLPEPLIVDVRDIDGHTKVDSESFMDVPTRAIDWAVEINGIWKQSPQGTGNDRFVLPVMWEDENDPSYHCPLDVSYRQKLVSA